MASHAPAMKSIGILTSGGDCSGLNAVIRAVVSHAIEHHGWRVIGIRQGTMGLMRRPVEFEELGLRVVTGNILRLAEVIEGYRQLGLDALIGIGGDGSFAILRRLAIQGGINLVGIPKTIDNDVGATENSVGFQSAVAVATEALDRLQPTAASHDRVMILEVMGRDAGHIALTAGIAGGADVILIPEIAYTIENVAAHIAKVRQRGRNFALVVVAEAVKDTLGQTVHQRHGGGGASYGGIGHRLGEALARLTGAETRVTVLGHVQRGGEPNAIDRLIGSVFGIHAVDLVAAGRFDRMVAWRNREVVDVPLADAIATPQCVDPQGALVRTARGLDISFGDA